MFFPKLDLSLPSKNSILIFDEINLQYLTKYLRNNKYYLIKIRGKNINVFALLYSVIFSYRSNTKVEYINFFLRFSKNKTLISQNFNRLILYQIKFYYPKTKIIIVQNGGLNNRFLNLLKNTKYKNLSCDYFLCFSKLESSIIQKYIKAKFIIIGSIRSNFYKIKNTNLKKEVLFISQYREDLINKPEFYNLYENERQVLPIIFEFCQKKNIKLAILPGQENYKKEKIHYSKLLKSNNFKMYIRNSEKSYSRVDNSFFSTGINSTLIYEAVGRKKRAGIFNFLKNYKNLDSEYVVFDKHFISNGRFWCKNFNKKKIFKILNYLYKISPKQWEKENSSKIKLSNYDENNSKFQTLIDKVLVTSKIMV
jgi:surface carbohydrate biosynthesis protein